MSTTDDAQPAPRGRDDTDELLALVYDDLKRRAAGMLGAGGRHATLQPTALVHEAYARLAQRSAHWADRAHFLSTAARAMRQILIDHARARRAGKRGGNHVRVTLQGLSDGADRELDLVELDDALRELSDVSERFAKVVELRFLGGLTLDETAEVLGVTARTVSNDWRAARAWLRDRIAR
ncbi:MAG: sigma-70 family RNA polymerase sigma factor [Planctomycetes bacterium]|nr:sigma-70 family RNA polymerase sigma factor [Planctomycetota bacterium]